MHLRYLLVLLPMLILRVLIVFSLLLHLFLLLLLLFFFLFLLLLLHFFQLFFLLQHPVSVLIMEHAAVSRLDVYVEERRLVAIPIVAALDQEPRLELREKWVAA